jgi:hypothetical protein
MWQAIALYVFTIIYIGLMLVSGRRANAKKGIHEFYQEKIREK